MKKANVIKVSDDMIKNAVWKLYQRGEISEEDYNLCEKRWMRKVQDGSGNEKIDEESSQKDNQGGKK
jgi:hypothetical protein